MKAEEEKKYFSTDLPTVTTETPSLSPTAPSLSLAHLSIPALLLDKAEVVSPLQPPLCLECYFVEYDSLDGKYHTIKTNQHSNGNFMREIVNLILSYVRVHVKSAPRPSHPPKSTPPKTMKPIVFSVFDSNRYAFVFETSDSRDVSSGIEISDKFVIFLIDHFLPYTLSEMVKVIAKEDHEDRTRLVRLEGQETVNAPSLAQRMIFLDFTSKYLRNSKKFYFSKSKDFIQQKQSQLQWYLRHVSTYTILIRTNTLHYQPMLLLTLLIHYAIREYKIILIGCKENRHIMSECVIGLKTALSPIEYCYPLVFAAISEGHEDYMDAPVPCLVCYWGQERDCGRMKMKYRRLCDEALMPTVLIDLDSQTALNSTMGECEARAIMDMNGFIVGEKKQEGSVVDRAKRYIREELMQGSREMLKDESQCLKKSLCYQHYQHSK